MIRQNTAAIVVSDPAVLHTDLILLAAYPGIIMIITGDSNTNAIIAIDYSVYYKYITVRNSKYDRLPRKAHRRERPFQVSNAPRNADPAAR